MSEAAAVRRPPRLLHAAVAATAVVVLAVTVPGTTAGGAAVLAATLAGFVAVWLVAGYRALDGGPGWLLVAAALLATAAIGAAVAPAFATFQVIAFPLAWLLAPGFRSAVALNTLVALAVGVGYAANTSLLVAVATQGVSLAFSLAMGVWISRIETRSEERQHLVDRLTAAQTEVAALSREAGTVAERERLARELHDTLTQSLAGIVMLAGRARARHPDDPGLEVLEDAARQAMSEARGLVASTAGVPLEGGLATALHTLADRFRRETGLVVEVEATAAVPRGLEVVLLRCAQEGLANARKHARATAVRVTVAVDGPDAVLTVADDGRGPGDGAGSGAGFGAGFGLAGMRDRVALAGGGATLAPGPHGGAVLTVRVPVGPGVGAGVPA